MAVTDRAVITAVCCVALLSLAESAAAQDPPRVPAAEVDTLTGFGPVYFDAGRHSIRADAIPLLERILRWLRINPGMRFRVEGNSDQWGFESDNLRVSKRRAESVVHWFVARGIAPSRFDVVAYGETRPVCELSDRACSPRERRADLVVTTYGDYPIVRPREELPPLNNPTPP